MSYLYQNFSHKPNIVSNVTGPLTSALVFGTLPIGSEIESATGTIYTKIASGVFAKSTAAISSTIQSALDLKANIAAPTFTGTVNGITKTMVGLASVDNTPDLSKPISSAQQSALNLKEDKSNKEIANGYAGLDVNLHTIRDPASRELANGVAGLDANLELIRSPSGAAAAAAGSLLDSAGNWVTRQPVDAAGAAIASAATVNLTTATGNLVHITGAVAVSAWTLNAGQRVACIADAALPLTFHATNNSLNSGGTNITLSAGDRFYVYSDGVTVRVDIIKLSGVAVVVAPITIPINGIGVGQTWQNVLAGRTANVVYTNSTGKPIQVFVSLYTNGSTPNATVNGLIIAWAASLSAYVTFSFIVPTGQTYTITNTWSANSINTWSELR